MTRHWSGWLRCGDATRLMANDMYSMRAKACACLLVCICAICGSPPSAGARSRPVHDGVCPERFQTARGARWQRGVMGGSNDSVAAADYSQNGEVIACVGARAIDGRLFRRWLHVAYKTSGPNVRRHPALVRAKTVTFVVSSLWVLGQAREWHVTVSARKVRQRLQRLRDRAFPDRHAYRSFKRRSGETEGDLVWRLHVRMLARLIRLRVAARAHARATPHSKAWRRERARAVERFVAGYNARWRRQTYCLPSYWVLDCGHRLPVTRASEERSIEGGLREWR